MFLAFTASGSFVQGKATGDGPLSPAELGSGWLIQPVVGGVRCMMEAGGQITKARQLELAQVARAYRY
jgi:hypothetical protein